MLMPASQKAGLRPIAFLLSDNGRIGDPLTLNIRPEELTSEEPSRLNVQQTLGGAWADSFGRGLRQINIRGHTGWRGGPTGDGADFYRDLRATVYTKWHRLRNDKLTAGNDPESVELIYSDRLNDIVTRVAPMRFHLRRHRTRPLLYQYQINMLDLGPVSDPEHVRRLTAPDPVTEIIDSPDSRYIASRDALKQIVSEQRQLAQDVAKFFGAAVPGPANFLNTSADLLERVLSATSDTIGADSATGPLITIAHDVARAGRNAYSLIARAGAIVSDTGVLAQSRILLQRVYAGFNSAVCNLLNGFEKLLRFLDFSPLFGASNCSSTGGGRPASIFNAINPFDAAFASRAPTVRMSAGAQRSLAAMQQDPVLTPLSASDAIAHLDTVASGIA